MNNRYKKALVEVQQIYDEWCKADDVALSKGALEKMPARQICEAYSAMAKIRRVIAEAKGGQND